MSTSEKVSRLLSRKIMSRAKLANDFFDCDESTLYRRLKKEGTTYQELLEQERLRRQEDDFLAMGFKTKGNLTRWRKSRNVRDRHRDERPRTDD